MALPHCQKVSISREIDPLPPIHLAGGGGGPDAKMLQARVFLALRQMLTLAERGVVDRGLAEVSLPSFPCVRVRGKVLGHMPQSRVK